MSLAAVPAIDPREKARGLEEAARAELNRALGLTVDVRAPTWRSLMFSGSKRIEFQVPLPPDEVVARVTALDPSRFAQDATGLAALKLVEPLQKSKPQGMPPASISARRPLPPSRSDVMQWDRQLFLLTAGPDCLPLLVGSGGLTPDDVDYLVANYPEGTDAQREAAVEGATAFTAAGARTGHDPELPAWLNDQLLTLMDEPRPTQMFQDIYQRANQQKPPQNGPPPGSGNSKIAQQFRPNVGAGSEGVQ